MKTAYPTVVLTLVAALTWSVFCSKRWNARPPETETRNPSEELSLVLDENGKLSRELSSANDMIRARTAENRRLVEELRNEKKRKSDDELNANTVRLLVIENMENARYTIEEWRNETESKKAEKRRMEAELASLKTCVSRLSVKLRKFRERFNAVKNKAKVVSYYENPDLAIEMRSYKDDAIWEEAVAMCHALTQKDIQDTLSDFDILPEQYLMLAEDFKRDFTMTKQNKAKKVNELKLLQKELLVRKNRLKREMSKLDDTIAQDRRKLTAMTNCTERAECENRIAQLEEKRENIGTSVEHIEYSMLSDDMLLRYTADELIKHEYRVFSDKIQTVVFGSCNAKLSTLKSDAKSLDNMIKAKDSEIRKLERDAGHRENQVARLKSMLDNGRLDAILHGRPELCLKILNRSGDRLVEMLGFQAN